MPSNSEHAFVSIRVFRGQVVPSVCPPVPPALGLDMRAQGHG